MTGPLSLHTRPARVPQVEGGLDPRRDALRDLRTVAPGVLPFGMFLGLTVAVTGTGWVPGLAGAALVYGGSAQLATTTLLSLGAGLLTAVTAGVVVNARLLLYGTALEPWFRGQPRWFRLLGPQFLIDQTYLSAVERPAYRGAPAFRRYWLWLGLTLLAVWMSSVGAGIAFAPLVPDMPHLVLVGTGLFVALLVPRLVDRASWASAAGGAGGALAVSAVAPGLAILAGALVGVVTGALVSTREASS
jgi:predicted branched-subunit amino acid permease